MKLNQTQIDKIVERGEIAPGNYIVLVDVAGRKDISMDQHAANIFRIDDENNIIWQVAAPPSPHGRDSFVSIDWSKNRLLAIRYFGTEFIVDEVTGEAREVGWRK